jgi:hypothetical protein
MRKKRKKPFVSVCTPTFNRRPFIKSMIDCFMHQTYPKNRIEWIIIDDGTDLIEELVINIPQVKYYKYDKKMSLGEKRNIMHDKSKGDIIVYMDDDDYYPPERISHAVETLINSTALCAGSSEIYIYFKHIQKMYQFGPYGPNHATAGTFAFKRELLKEHKYNNNAALAEERAFLKNYTVPFVQLNPFKTILVFSHNHNTFDKKKLLQEQNTDYVKESNKTVDMFIKEEHLKQFFMFELEEIIESYVPGLPSMKPDVLQQIIEIEEERRKAMERFAYQNQPKIVVNNNGVQKEITMKDAVDILQKQQKHINELIQVINGKNTEIDFLKNSLSKIKENVEKTTEKICDTKMPVLQLPECKTTILDEINLEN